VSSPVSSRSCNSFLTLAQPSEHREDVKDSRFLAYAARADDPSEAIAFLQTIAHRHADASHLCWAYRIGGSYRYSDGGEPGGTAGPPILRAIEGQGLDRIVVGVIRYFGGTKLGAGGLTRAYGGSAAEALRKAEKCTETPQMEIAVVLGFEHMGSAYRALDGLGAQRLGEEYDEHGVILTARIAHAALDSLENLLRDATRGQFELRVL
jgi:uncharacterized YigZ family protein